MRRSVPNRDPVGRHEPIRHSDAVEMKARVRRRADRVCARFLGLLGKSWRFLRQVSGDDAYDRYLAHMSRSHPGQPVMGRGTYFRARQEQRWSRISRCC